MPNLQLACKKCGLVLFVSYRKQYAGNREYEIKRNQKGCSRGGLHDFDVKESPGLGEDTVPKGNFFGSWNN